VPGQRPSGRQATPTPARPNFADSYGVPRHAGPGLMPWTEVSQRLARARNYWVATTRPDGRPHAAPVWGVWLDDMLCFGTDRVSRKARNLAVNPALTVHLESGDDAVILEGVAEEMTDPALLARFSEAYEAKYRWRPEAPGRIAYALRTDVAFAWRESDFPHTATRWDFRTE
jgi:hypothetical protein